MEVFLRAKHWQVFILGVFLHLLGTIFFTSSPSLQLLGSATGILMVFIYPFMVGYLLQDYLPSRVQLKYTFFIINSFLWLGAYLVALILFEGQKKEFSGLSGLLFFYIVFAFFYSFAFPAKAIKSIEMRSEASFGDYFYYFFLMLAFPLGIWILQPKINKIVARGKTAAESVE
ncbi:hypothetical protein TH61_01980 [Rufibacter sp. DG15C]|uniref:hypothetical protein n=1 Tax=Rufibacter sp. DG15C TaxID=1379909 RepID=UPI00078D6ADB|nr:hypothetical protein [Rufibacter sp. DG15C]AMM50187.1 hypothetical protein TH61_01980 [Rufibacter sp. DG15C]